MRNVGDLGPHFDGCRVRDPDRDAYSSAHGASSISIIRIQSAKLCCERSVMTASITRDGHQMRPKSNPVRADMEAAFTFVGRIIFCSRDPPA